MPEHLGKGEMLEQSHEVSKGLVEGEHIGIGGIHEMLVETIQQRMGHFVRDNVMG